MLLWIGAVVMAAALSGCAGEGSPPAGGGEADGSQLFPDLEGFTGLPDRPRATASSAFWDAWGDGRAELSGYRMTIRRYGAAREAELALIYVTEPHDRRTWIKDDGAEEPERVEVLKLNQSMKFLTGAYPYSVMTSTFAPVDRYRNEAFSPVRIVHAVQEWCGAYTHLLWPGPNRFRSLRLSYFASEGERMAEVETSSDVLYEDALLIQLRELDGPFAGGGDWEGEIVPELWRLRANHGDLRTVPARITREEAVRSTDDGDVPVTRFTLEAGEYRRVYDVEREAPRRILGWRTSTGDEAELLATDRMAYWDLNDAGDESVRERIGLSPAGSIPPAALPDAAGGCGP